MKKAWCLKHQAFFAFGCQRLRLNPLRRMFCIYMA